MQLQNNIPRSSDPTLRHHSIAKVRSVNNNVLKRQNDKKADTATSVIKGPRSGATALNFDTKILADDDFSRYGKTVQTIPSCAGTYRYIDTTVKVVGSTGTIEQIPLRIIQKE